MSHVAGEFAVGFRIQLLEALIGVEPRETQRFGLPQTVQLA